MPVRSAWRPGALLGALAVALVGAAPASASEGSVPAEVAAYVEDGGLIERLDDMYGLDASGRGVAFDDSTETGPISRVFRWSDARLAGEETDDPVRLVNEWVVPISIAEKPVGVATVWINPESVAPELSEFVAETELAIVLSEVPDDAALVRDDGADAWFALEDGIVTPLVPGRSGLETPAPLDVVAIVPPAVPVPPEDPGTGTAVAIAVVMVLLLVIVAALLIPRRVRADEGAHSPESASARRG